MEPIMKTIARATAALILSAAPVLAFDLPNLTFPATNTTLSTQGCVAQDLTVCK
jgi:hypothetical protein